MHTVVREHDLFGGYLADLRNGRGIQHQRSQGELRESLVLDRFRIHYESTGPGQWRVRTPEGSEQRFTVHSYGCVLTELANRTRELATFDTQQRCESKLSWREGAPQAQDFACYRYTPEGDLRELQDSRRGLTSYEYDRSHRLVRERNAYGRDDLWEYDAAGNITTHPTHGRAQLGPSNKLKTFAGDEILYDARDNIVEIRHPESSARPTGGDNGARIGHLDKLGHWQLLQRSNSPRLWRIAPVASP